MYLYYHFTEFAGPDFTWPLTSEISERRDIYDYITDPYHLYIEGQGKELAINRLACLPSPCGIWKSRFILRRLCPNRTWQANEL